ncbi:MAG: metallophosphoesterase [Verrucomicrobia bacterium]|nr:metallophosphoesterase [Verrucomicrobiota bacterium]MCH8510989.1 metallophosphoesterase [Kiritimatiellia bacterium]
MKIIPTPAKQLHNIPYFRVTAGSRGVECIDLPVYSLRVDRLPHGISALLVTSDLQGMEALPGKKGGFKPGPRQLGEAAAESLTEFCLAQGHSPKQVGILFTGDLHSDPTLSKRGGHGDVRSVWHAFRDHFAWAGGIAGNHDTFGSPAEQEAFLHEPNIYFLDHGHMKIRDLRIGGISGVMGSNQKPWRTPEPVFLERLGRILATHSDLVLLHEGPDFPERGFDGKPQIREILEAAPPRTVVFGHRHWPTADPVTLPNGTQLLNTDAKAYLLTTK